jgi:hypothetical protein
MEKGFTNATQLDDIIICTINIEMQKYLLTTLLSLFYRRHKTWIVIAPTRDARNMKPLRPGPPYSFLCILALTDPWISAYPSLYRLLGSCDIKVTRSFPMRGGSPQSGLEHHCSPSNRSWKGARKKGEGVRAPFPLYSLSFPVPPTAQVVATCGDALLSSVHVEAVVGVEGHKRGGEEARWVVGEL